jgi:diguanylate cyclase (GGDEF)-like protein
VRRGQASHGERADAFYVIGASGQFADCLSSTLDKLTDAAARESVEEALLQKQHVFGSQATVLYLQAEEHMAAVYIRSHEPLAPLDRQLVEVFATNISAYFGNVQLISELNRLAFSDGLTGLANRVQFIKEIESILTHRVQTESQLVMLLDVKRFSDTNNGLGHDVGNAYLLAISQGLRAGFSSQTKVARLSGDVFGLVGPASELSAERASALFDAGVVAGEHRLAVDFAAGTYSLADHQDSAIAAFGRANIALSSAKVNELAVSVQFHLSMEEQTNRRLALMRQLRTDMQAHLLEIWYQPQISLSDGVLVGVEALMRWPNGSGGMLESPAVFIPIAEQAGLIDELGLWSMHRAAEDLSQLKGMVGAPPRVSVNVSMQQFRSGNLGSQVAEVLTRFALQPGALELEITEGIAMDEPHLVVTTLQALRDLGVRVALDDFGTGYSSLSQVRNLPIDVLKIDRAFVNEIGELQGELFVSTVLALGTGIKAEIIAEGVETESQANFLRQQGCHIAQGWLYAKAMPLHELKIWMANRA